MGPEALADREALADPEDLAGPAGRAGLVGREALEDPVVREDLEALVGPAAPEALAVLCLNQEVPCRPFFQPRASEPLAFQHPAWERRA